MTRSWILCIAAISLSTACGGDAPPGGGDFSTPPDMTARDMAIPRDFAVPPDFSVPPDNAVPPDLTVLPDLLSLPDLVTVPDIVVVPDLVTVPDIVVVPDLKLPTCTDGVKNGAETDADCGGPTCPRCAIGKMCTANTDCAAGASCALGVCTKGELIAYYKFDEAAGAAILDSSGNNRNGTHNAAYAAGKKGTALSVSGTTFGIVAGNLLPSWGANNDDFTVEYWIRVTVAPTGMFRCIIHKGNNDMERTSGHWLDTAVMRINAADSTTTNYNDVLYSTTFAVDQWVHFAVVKKGNTRTAYVNAVQTDSHAISPTVGNNGPLYIGDDPVWPGMQGQLDELRIYTRALTVQEIQADMQ